MKKGLIGKKIGMTQIFTAEGKVIPVTVVEAGPCVVTQKKTMENDGYEAVQVGFGDVKINKVNKPMKGHFDKNGVAPKKTLKEFRLEDCSALNVGDIINAKVTHLEKFGAFIDIGAGINALIPIDMLSVSRINHPRERLYEGEDIKVVLRKREPEKLTFSLKELLGTWRENAALFEPGETVTGTVRSIEPYGVFVELMPNLAGLAEPCDYLFEGQQVAVYIKSVLPDKMKIKLVIVEAFDESKMAEELTYFVHSEHIDRFDYSTPNAPKEISTVFDEEIQKIS